MALASTPPHDSAARRPGFVSVAQGRFDVDGAPHRFVGANLWYAAYLGAESPFGNRARLRRELDRLAALGVTNLRLLAGSEHSPLENSVRPAFRDASARYDETLLEGLDFVLAEMAERGQRAVLYLTNFWEWSGGMMTYLFWTNGGHYVDMADPARPWPAFPDFVPQFYEFEAAIALYHDYVRALVSRTNRRTGIRYADDPTIFSFQLANEPRPGVSEPVVERYEAAFLRWVTSTARLLKTLAPHHLVSTGSEGLTGCAGREETVIRAHSSPDVDYLTAHVWPQNWGWIDPHDLPGTSEDGFARSRSYLARHVELAEQLGRPLVIEEFGFPRDGGSFDETASVTFRDRFYALVHEAVLASARTNGPLMGSNFWAFGGEGRAPRADRRFRRGDVAYLGDPPHEPQGWYSVFDADRSTTDALAAHARALRALDR